MMTTNVNADAEQKKKYILLAQAILPYTVRFDIIVIIESKAKKDATEDEQMYSKAFAWYKIHF